MAAPAVLAAAPRAALLLQCRATPAAGPRLHAQQRPRQEKISSEAHTATATTSSSCTATTAPHLGTDEMHWSYYAFPGQEPHSIQSSRRLPVSHVSDTAAAAAGLIPAHIPCGNREQPAVLPAHLPVVRPLLSSSTAAAGQLSSQAALHASDENQTNTCTKRPGCSPGWLYLQVSCPGASG